MKRSEHYSNWDGTCARCGHSYFECRGHCTCLSCNAQRQAEVRDGLIFDEDLEAGETLAGLQAELQPGYVPPPVKPFTRASLRRRREVLGLTQEQLAVRAGIAVVTLSRIEQGKSLPHRTSVEALERVLREAEAVKLRASIATSDVNKHK